MGRPSRMMFEDFPTSARFWITLYTADFFEVEVLFFSFHFLLMWYLYWLGLI